MIDSIIAFIGPPLVSFSKPAHENSHKSELAVSAQSMGNIWASVLFSPVILATHPELPNLASTVVIS